MKSYKKAEKIQLKIDAKSDLSNTYNSIATVHALKKKFDLALIFYKKSLKFSQESNSAYGIALGNQNIGNVLLDQKKYKESLPHFQKAYEIQKENNNKAHLLETLTSLSFLHMELGELNKSKFFLEININGIKNCNTGYKGF